MKTSPSQSSSNPHQRSIQRSLRPSRRRVLIYVGASLGVFVLTIALLFMAFGGAILSRYGKAKAERAYAAAYPGSTLRIGELEYALRANRLIARRVTVSAADRTLEVGQITLTDVRWTRLLWRKAAPADVLAQARVEATTVTVEFPDAYYRLRCERLHASVPDSEFIAEGTELQPLVGDEAFFAAHPFRETRFRVVLPECRVLGLAYDELLRGSAYRARSVHLSRPSLEALINRDKEPAPFVKSPLLVHEALAAIRQPLRVDHFSITNGSVAYAERTVPGADPAVLTFGAMSLSADGIANRGEPTAAIELEGRGDLMSAATLQVRMSIPITPADFTFHYSGVLGAMDLTRLNAFLELAELIRINSGSAQEAEFEIKVRDGQARGRVRAIYDDLGISVLDQQTGSASGFENRITSFLANALKVRKSNAPDSLGSMRVGDVTHTRSPDETFLEFVWISLLSGLLDVISH
jgi:hypothetical protein